MTKKKIILLALLILTVALLAAGVGLEIRRRHMLDTRNDRVGAKLFTEALNQVKQRYVEPVDDNKLIKGAINGMLAALDPHSAYFPADFFKEVKVEISGEFGGLGIEINIKDGRLMVISPIDDTPAFKAGIKSGDHIWKINGVPTMGLTVNEAVNRMRGPKGSQVTLAIIREGVAKPLLFPLTRDMIRIKSLKFRTLTPGFGYIRIAQFQERTGYEFDKALKSLHEQNGGTVKGLVLDLRNNPGGLLDTAVQVANRFIGVGFGNALIVYTEGRTPNSRQTISATIGGKEPSYPIVALINGGSASASEIVAGALQDHGRAVIMGTQSFGKGSVQSIMPLRGGAGLKLTTALYYTPNGRSIQARGITPDIIVAQQDLNSVKKNETRYLHEKDLEGHIEARDKEPPVVEKKPVGKKETATAKPDKDMAGDYQLSRALELMQGIEALRLLGK
jgi:carboxyl-terminal processing protease